MDRIEHTSPLGRLTHCEPMKRCETNGKTAVSSRPNGQRHGKGKVTLIKNLAGDISIRLQHCYEYDPGPAEVPQNY